MISLHTHRGTGRQPSGRRSWLMLIFLATCLAAFPAISEMALATGIVQPQNDVITVPVTCAYTGQPPATIDLRFTYDPAVLAYKEAQPGSASVEAGKNVYAYTPQAGILAIVITGGISVLSQGVVAYLSFTTLADIEAYQDITCTRAGAATIDGASLEVVAFDGGVMPKDSLTPPQPQLLTASRGQFASRIRIQWAEVAGASHYVVYRSASPYPEEAVTLAESVTALRYDDDSPDISSWASPGCPARPGNGFNDGYWYWVAARNDYGEGPWSAPATGYVSGATTADTAALGVSALLLGLAGQWLTLHGRPRRSGTLSRALRAIQGDRVKPR